MKDLEGTNVFIAEKDLKGSTFHRHKNGQEHIARPIGYIGFFFTLDCAWKVLTHKADIVTWRDYNCDE